MDNVYADQQMIRMLLELDVSEIIRFLLGDVIELKSIINVLHESILE